MTTPFLALAPQIPRVVDIPYAAFAPVCVDVTDVSDMSDQPTDVSDSTDSGGDIVI